MADPGICIGRLSCNLCQVGVLLGFINDRFLDFLWSLKHADSESVSASESDFGWSRKVFRDHPSRTYGLGRSFVFYSRFFGIQVNVYLYVSLDPVKSEMLIHESHVSWSLLVIQVQES